MTAVTAGTEFRRGWRVLLAAAAAVACASSNLPFNTLGALVKPLEQEFGWQRGDIQFGYFLFTMLSGLSYPFAGLLIDRFGARPLAIVGVCAFGVSFAAIGLSSDSLTTFYALWMLMGLMGAAATPITFTRMINEWFVVRRGLALSLALVVAGSAAAVQQIASTFLVESVGWRLTLAAMALMPLLIALPLVLLFFRPPLEGAVMQAKDRARGLDLRAALGGYRFYVISGAIICVTLGIAGVAINLRPLMSDAGISTVQAAFIAGSLGISTTVGRLGVGLVIDRVWAPGLCFPFLALPAVACVLLAYGSLTPAVALIAAVLIGLAAGAEADVLPYLTARYFGLRHYGRIFGMLFAIFIIASGISPFLFGLAYEHYGTYAPALNLSAVLFVAGAALLLTLGAYPEET